MVLLKTGLPMGMPQLAQTKKVGGAVGQIRISQEPLDRFAYFLV